ncbi:hypothetical protein WUBG_10721 [Wuchereria bancrofti]|uniref:Uncharacterized protein n=1 Tax=Wuchereria bancrofti TaxID=6293 RepID=J9E7S2_WUCBA|nr:hypothetical protein WUBG_18876 [Wuchereria bancrofti]EJW78371.1 hypothetical protein WUBG_10721 [Wuchereria bancrofti]
MRRKAFHSDHLVTSANGRAGCPRSGEVGCLLRFAEVIESVGSAGTIAVFFIYETMFSRRINIPPPFMSIVAYSR